MIDPVVTYQHAYIPGTTTLCSHHADHTPAGFPALGAVSHGAHEGECEACGVEKMLRQAERR